MDELIAELAASGVVALPGRPPVMCPPEAAAVSECRQEDGRIDEIINLADPDARHQVNNSFLQLASRFGLFGEHGDFLLAVNFERDGLAFDVQWIRVRLADSWDMAGRYSGTICGPSRDGLHTMSLDGKLIISATTYENGWGSVAALPDPHRAAPVRRAVGYLLDSGKTPDTEKETIRAWLDQD